MKELPTHSNFDEILPLIELYQEFYEVAEISTEKNRRFFSQFIGGTSEGAQFIFREDGKAIGFATIYFSFSSSIVAKVAVLNDLFVLPELRKKGIAKALIAHCYQYGLSKGAVRLQWLTAKSNTNAQAAYNKLGAKKSEWVFYSYAP
ncbi:MAG: GNAT family N-acetyltransferase [Verrucomicrobia bacterium]|nr:GNAT family N-acetyltransferase [Verrucomicrobiota bacterium]